MPPSRPSPARGGERGVFCTPVFGKKSRQMGLGTGVPAPLGTAHEPGNSCWRRPGQPGSRARRGAGSARARARGRGRGGAGGRTPVGPRVPGPRPRPPWHGLGGRRGVAVRRAGSGPGASPRGAWHGLASPRLPSSGARPDPGPPASWEPRLHSDAVPGPGRRGGSIIHGAPGRAPKTCSALGLPGGVGREDRGKVPRVNLATFLISPKLSIEHLLDAWDRDPGGAARGCGETGSLRGPPIPTPRRFRRKQCLRLSAPDQVREEKGSLRLPPLFLPLPFLPPGCISLAPPLLINSSHTPLLSPAFQWRVPSPSEEQMWSPIVSPPSDCGLPGPTCSLAPLPLPPPQPGGLGLQRLAPQGHCPSPHPEPAAPGDVSDDCSHSEHDLFLTASEKTVA